MKEKYIVRKRRMKYIVLRWIRGNMGEIKEYIYEYLREYRRIYDEKKRYDDK